MKFSKLQIFRFTIFIICMLLGKFINVRLSWLWLSFLVLLLGPFFCGWTCPFGFTSRLMNKLGSKFLPNLQYELPPKLQRLLVLTKYIVFAGFIFTILLPQIGIDITEEYTDFLNHYVYLKTLFGIPAALILANYYCRYFCWNKAQYNVISQISPCAIKTDKDRCLKCGACARVCPMKRKPFLEKAVRTDCIMCMQCIDACPLPEKAVALTIFGKKVSCFIIGTFYLIAYLTALYLYSFL